MWSLLVSILAIFLTVTTYASGTCYLPGGTALPDTSFYNAFQPCTSGGPSSICCATGRTNPAGGNGTLGDTADECLPNGLCQNRVEGQATSYWLNFCTDPDLASGNCLNVCNSTRDASGNTALTPCTGKADSDKWCCGGDNSACCTSNVGVVLLAQVLGGTVSSSVASSTASQTSSGTSSTASASASTSASASSSGTGAPAAATSAAPGKGSSGISGGAIAGIVIAVLAGLALLAAALFFARRAASYKKQAARPNYAEVPAHSNYPLPAEAPADNSYPPQYPGHEKYAQQNRPHVAYELGSAPPSELPSGDYPSAPLK